MMKALTHNIQQEREDQRDRSAQLFMWCIVVSMHQDDGIGASRLLRACNEMDAFEKKYQTAILYGSSKNATDAMRENLKGICDFEVRLPVDRAPRGRREEQLRMASNQGAEIAWLVMAATCHETFGYGRDRLARLKQNSMNNYKQYLEWEKEDKDLALDRLRRCVQDALKEDLRVTDTDDRKGMLSDISRVCEDMDIHLSGVNAKSGRDGSLTMTITLSISSTQEMQKVQRSLRNIEGVLQVYRAKS